MTEYPPKPTLSRSDLPELTELLSVFDTITFNDDNEMVGKASLIGAINVSYLAREKHLRISTPDDTVIYSDYFTDRELTRYNITKLAIGAMVEHLTPGEPDNDNDQSSDSDSE